MELFTCLHPRKIFNPYIKEYMYVECRNCIACRQKRGAILKNRLMEEFNNNKYCLMLSLHYDNEHLPGFYIMNEKQEPLHSFHSNGRYYPMVTMKSVKNYDSLLLFPNDKLIDYSCPKRISRDFGIQNIHQRIVNLPLAVNHPNCFVGVLFKRDVQLFIKRLRKKISKIYEKEKEKQKLRYYCVGEYGSTTLRPHYHVLVWSNFDDVLETIEESVSTCWQNGNCDVQRADAGTSQYLSEYVVSGSNLPAVLQMPDTKPFYLCSKKPYIGTPANDTKIFEDIFLNGNVQHTVRDVKSKELLSVRYSASYISTRIPRCQGFNTLSYPELLRTYSYIYEYLQKNPHLIKKYNEKKLRLCDIEFPECYNYDDKRSSMFAYRINRTYGFSIRETLNRVMSTYSKLDYLNLCSQMEMEQKYFSNLSNVDYDILFIDNLFFDKLPYYLNDLSLEQVDIIESFNLSVYDVYEYDKFNNLKKKSYENCKDYCRFVNRTSSDYRRKIKEKDKVDYRNSIHTDNFFVF